MIDASTIAFYDRQTDAHMKIADRDDNPHLTRLIEGLPAGAHVLDLGCGPGQYARQFARAGLRVTAMDASPEMIRQAALNDGVNVRHASFDALDDLETFDAVWASFSLLHTPKAQFPVHLRAVRRALKPGGSLVLSLLTGLGEGHDALGRFYAYYQEEELTGHLESAGFRVAGIVRGKSRGMAETEAPFVVVTAHAPARADTESP